MNIMAVHTYLAEELLPMVAITSPVASTIRRAWPLVPPINQAITEWPTAMMPDHTLEAMEFKSAWLRQLYSINLQLFVAPAEVEQDVAAEMSAAYLEALGLAFSGAQRLGGTASVIRGVRGKDPTLARLTWASKPFIGLDLLIDVTLQTTKEHSA